jgi:hypothetical protein
MRDFGNRSLRSRVALALVVGVGTWLATAACELLLPTRLEEPGQDAAPPPLATPPPSCGVHPPEDPAGATGSGSLLVAVRQFEFQASLSDAGFGLNLDRVCTCDDAGYYDGGVGPPSCQAPYPEADPSVSAKVACDAPGGRDIGGITGLGSYFQAALGGTTAGGTLDDRIANGLVSFFFRVRNLPPDGADGSNVEVSFFNASGHFNKLATPQADGSTLEPVAPAWDGTDVWAINCAQSAAACSSAYDLPDAEGVVSGWVDFHAYVRGGVLVANFPKLLIDFNFTDLLLSNVVVVANLTNGGLTGQIAGRLPFHELYRSLSAVPVGGAKKGEYLCGTDPVFQGTIRPAICKNLDLRADPSTDNTGQLCDALGVAFQFTASPAQFAHHVDPGPYLHACDGGDSPGDNCTMQ